ncbi:hypothetical protein K0B04_04310 [Patescibacteria group bacterium]|nr:hypothetical protein [Patescibacteria group bacterium]
MSLLAAHFDTSGVSFLIQKRKNNIELVDFPYVYSKGILSNQCTKREFYTYLIEKFLSDRQIKSGTCNILTSGFMDPPEIDLKTKFSVSVVDLIENTDEFVPVYVNSSSFLTKGFVSSYENCRSRNDRQNIEIGVKDRSANLCIFPQVIPADVSSQTNQDSEVYKKIPNNLTFESGRKIVFTGGRFSQKILNKELNYILMLDLLKGYGVFEAFLDNSNALSLFRIMQMYDMSLVPNLYDYIENTGTIIRTGGQAECLLSTGIGDDKFIEIEENKIFVLPLNVENLAKLSVKSSVLGTIDIRTSGGRVGLILDTRTQEESIYSDVKIFNDCVKQFGGILKEN